MELRPFPPPQPLRVDWLEGRRLALMATGGSGALASVVGAARALEEAGVRPAVISLCSGSALFGFPVAVGIPAAEVAEFLLALRAGGLRRRRLAPAVLVGADGRARLRRHHQGGADRGDLPAPAGGHDPGRAGDPGLRADMERRGEPARLRRPDARTRT